MTITETRTHREQQQNSNADDFSLDDSTLKLSDLLPVEEDYEYDRLDFPIPYSSFLSEKSYDGSCVFQGPVGGTLPREIRSVTCNRFLCEPIINLQMELRADSASQCLAISIDEDESVQRFAILSHRMESAK